MSDEAQRWKEKYLKSIEQQDKLERRWAARLDLLRRGLVRSTLAAEGTDKVVDQCMKEMRDVVRTDDMDAGLAALLPRLEKAVLDSEQRRETRIDQVSTALTSLVTQLQALPLPREVAQPLKKFAKQLDGRVGQAREMPLLLSELSGLQGKALSQLETPPNLAVRGCCSVCLAAETAKRRQNRRAASSVCADVRQRGSCNRTSQRNRAQSRAVTEPGARCRCTAADSTAPTAIIRDTHAQRPQPSEPAEPDVVAFVPPTVASEVSPCCAGSRRSRART